MKLFEGLNESQIKAAQHIDGAMLILAGAGSGKTKTITTRLAYLISEVGIPAHNTLTLTFTNKAASEMKTRALNLVKNRSNENPLLCTFHKFGLLFLRLHIEKLGRKNDFSVLDTNDTKKILREFIDEKENASNVLHYISHFKNHSKGVEEVFEDLSFFRNEGEKYQKFEKIASYYKSYQNYLLKYNFVDFDDLLMLSNTLLEMDKSFAGEQSEFYHYITVDEYQDTNDLQHKILKNLCSIHENICVVGDDDQSIYSWRGAKIDNILNFQNEFQNVKLVRLEKNYRSTEKILQTANELIKHNQNRLGKELICTKEQGNEIEILRTADEKIEGEELVLRIKKLLQEGVKAREIAVLFRVNALSRSLEEALNKGKIAYKLLSGVRFYERLEIKNILYYLRFLSNLNDDFSFKNIINYPKRGFGAAALKKLELYAIKEKTSLFEALCNVEGSGFFAKKLDNELHQFIEHIKNLKECENLEKLFEKLESEFKFKDYYKTQADGEDRIRNLDEFYAQMKDKIKNENHENLNEILNELSLLSEQDGVNGDCVYVMSIHASKGLEFDYVFIVGLEEGFFPLNSETNDIEEERRLAYVAITRAKKALCLSCVDSRFYRGSRTTLEKSRFLSESKVIEEESKGYKKGDLIKHKIFGIGRVVDVAGAEKEQKLCINFGGIERTILASFVEKAL